MGQLASTLAGAGTGLGLGALLGNVLDYPRRTLWESLGLPGQGNELISNLTGMEQDSPWAQALGFGAELAGDPLNLASGGLGALLGGSKVGRAAGGVLGDMGQDVVKMFQEAPAAAGRLQNRFDRARPGIVDMSWMWDRPSNAESPLNLLGNIRQDAYGASLAEKMRLRETQQGIWDEFIGQHGLGIDTAMEGFPGGAWGSGPTFLEKSTQFGQQLANPDTYGEIAARLQELRNENELGGLFGREAMSGLVGNASNQHGPLEAIFRSARENAGVAPLDLALSNSFRDAEKAIQSPLDHALGAPSGIRGVRHHGMQGSPTPRGLDKIVAAANQEGYHIPPELVAQVMHRSENALPRQILDEVPSDYIQYMLEGDSLVVPPNTFSRPKDMLKRFAGGRWADYSPEELAEILTRFYQNPTT